jgi:drug/metabolite transporter (DMT)-like permease
LARRVGICVSLDLIGPAIVLLAHVIFGEKITALNIAGAAAVIVGIALMSY